MGSGKGWTSEEIVAACKAYVSASEDPRSGSGKKKDVFAKQVLECYNWYMEEVKHNNKQLSYSERTGDAVVQRYRKARCEGLKFEGIVASIKTKKPTGDPSEEDITRAALAVYNGDARIGDMYTYLGDRRIDPGPDFPFEDALWFLRNTNTWSMIILSKQNRAISNAGISENIELAGEVDESQGVTRADSPSNQSVSNSAIGLPNSLNTSKIHSKKERPLGAKRALEISKQVAALHKGAEGIEKLAEASQKRTKVAEGMLQIEKQQSMIALFSMPGTDPSVQQRFVKLSQLKALAALENEVSSIGEEQHTPVQNNPLTPDQNASIPFANKTPLGSISSILNQT